MCMVCVVWYVCVVCIHMWVDGWYVYTCGYVYCVGCAHTGGGVCCVCTHAGAGVHCVHMCVGACTHMWHVCEHACRVGGCGVWSAHSAAAILPTAACCVTRRGSRRVQPELLLPRRGRWQAVQGHRLWHQNASKAGSVYLVAAREGVAPGHPGNLGRSHSGPRPPSS